MHFLQASLIGIASLSMVSMAGCTAPETTGQSTEETTIQPVVERPNILIVITDDQSYPHASAYGSTLVNTPTFDRVAREGFLFEHAFVSAPSCGPSRASLLTGQPFYTLGTASMNHTEWEASLDTLPDILSREGYSVGYTGKGWAPGVWDNAGRSMPPTGDAYNDLLIENPGELGKWDYAANFEAFTTENPDGPFFFWVGIYEPHRPFEVGVGERNGYDVGADNVPAFLPDADDTRMDMEDYAYEIEYQDAQVGKILARLEELGELENTLIVMTSDNGMAFPRAKATVYDSGARVPTAMRWPGATSPGATIGQFVSLLDIAPTIMDAVGLDTPSQMQGISLLPMLESDEPNNVDLGRDALVWGVERHFPGARPEGAGYPMRALRTEDYLYVRNYTPDANAVGDRPGLIWPADDDTGGFGDIDGGLSKSYLWDNREDYPKLADLAFGNRPAEELYVVETDPDQLNNVAGDPAYGDILASLSEQLDDQLAATGDPRATGQAQVFEDIFKRFPGEGPSGLDE